MEFFTSRFTNINLCDSDRLTRVIYRCQTRRYIRDHRGKILFYRVRASQHSSVTFIGFFRIKNRESDIPVYGAISLCLYSSLSSNRYWYSKIIITTHKSQNRGIIKNIGDIIISYISTNHPALAKT